LPEGRIEFFLAGIMSRVRSPVNKDAARMKD